MNTETPVALITGAGRRIGAAMAKALHAEGYRILVHYRQSANDAETLVAALNSERPDSAHTLCADLADMTAVKTLAQQAQDHWGRLDVLINNASSFYPTLVGDITEEHWQDLFASNAQAPLFLSQALAPALKQQHGCIINIADIHARRPLKGYTTYCMAKAANTMLTQSLARELAPEVRVNSIAPGAILWPENDAEVDDSTKQQMLDEIPLQRTGTEADIARTAVFLIQQADYITGQIIAVDGGRSLK
ncbi:pteridine reductase [Maricurvus nonylphenolicus]|uniref:pteridine reductase n=1 Tax=Maricurvus nonylphenolicus TaxID=1008307 RepID=UPI0036F269CC